MLSPRFLLFFCYGTVLSLQFVTVLSMVLDLNIAPVWVFLMELDLHWFPSTGSAKFFDFLLYRPTQALFWFTPDVHIGY